MGTAAAAPAAARKLRRDQFIFPPVRFFPSYLASVQLSENASAQVLNGRPSRCFGQGCPAAWTPFRTSRAPNAGINTVHTP
jgi:hypothetical protein